MGQLSWLSWADEKKNDDSSISTNIFFVYFM